MWCRVPRVGGARLGMLALLLAACGQSTRGESGVNGNAGSSNGGGDDAADCSAPVPIDSLLGSPVELPTRLEGVLCEAEDTLDVTFVDDPTQRVFAAELAAGSGEYSLSLLGSELQPYAHVRSSVPLQTEPQVLTLSAASPVIYFAMREVGFDDDRITLELSGSLGPVALDITRPELDPFPDCDGAYESLPVETPPHELPAVFGTELCHARDSRVFAIEVAAGRPVTITLENPKAVDSFALSVYENADGYLDLPVSSGSTRATLGLLAAQSMSFTPVTAGVVALYASLGDSRGDGIELDIEQP